MGKTKTAAREVAALVKSLEKERKREKMLKKIISELGSADKADEAPAVEEENGNTEDDESGTFDDLKEVKKKEAAEDGVFPCVLKIMPNCVYNKDPIILGVDVKEGILKIGTPICIPQKNFIDIGRISSIENNHRPVDYAKKGQKVVVMITGSNAEEQQKKFWRHFDMDDELVSHISRHSIDVLKSNCRQELSIEEWKLMVQLKHLFKIQ